MSELNLKRGFFRICIVLSGILLIISIILYILYFVSDYDYSYLDNYITHKYIPYGAFILIAIGFLWGLFYGSYHVGIFVMNGFKKK